MSIFHPVDGPAVVITPWSRVAVWGELMAHGMQNHNFTSQVWPIANACVGVPFTLNEPFIVRKLFAANGAVVSGNIDVGVLTSEGNLIVSAGATAQAGALALQSFTIAATTLVPGRYFMAIGLNNTTGTLLRRGPNTGTMGRVGILTFPLPAISTFTTAPELAPVFYMPGFGLSSRTLL